MTIVGASTGLKSHNLSRTAQRKVTVVAIVVGGLRLFILGVSVSEGVERLPMSAALMAALLFKLSSGIPNINHMIHISFTANPEGYSCPSVVKDAFSQKSSQEVNHFWLIIKTTRSLLSFKLQ